MTIPSTARKAGPLLGTGVQTAWPFTFKVFAAADVAVTIADSLGVETALVLDTDYSVTLNANQETSPGGTVTYPISGTPLAVGSKLSIIGDLDYDQPLDLPSGGNFSPLALENELDRVVMQIQQLDETQSRALVIPVTSDVDPVLPAPEAGMVIGWNTAANALVNVDAASLASVTASAYVVVDKFTGDGTTTQFVCSQLPGSTNAAEVTIAGVMQNPAVDYTVSGARVVFTSAPANGTVIIARFLVAASQSSGSAYATERQVATAGQTAFTLANSYAPGAETLSVFVNGLLMSSAPDYAETSANVVTFTSGLALNDEVVFHIWRTNAIGVADSVNVAYSPAGTGAVATTVQTKLRSSVSRAEYTSDGNYDTARSLLTGRSDLVIRPNIETSDLLLSVALDQTRSALVKGRTAPHANFNWFTSDFTVTRCAGVGQASVAQDIADVFQTKFGTFIGGAVSYVHPSGSDTNGGSSWRDAFLTVAKALRTTSNGTIYLWPGTYALSDFRYTDSYGDHPKKIIAPFGGVTLRVAGDSASAATWVLDGDYGGTYSMCIASANKPIRLLRSDLLDKYGNKMPMPLFADRTTLCTTQNFGWCYEANKSVTATVTPTSGSPTLTTTNAHQITVGMAISGTGIPGGATVTAVVPGTSITISANATSSPGAITATATGNILTVREAMSVNVNTTTKNQLDIVYGDSAGDSRILLYSTTSYWEGITVYGYMSVLNVAGQATPQLWAKKCTFAYAGTHELLVEGGYCYTQDCIGMYGAADGANYNTVNSIVSRGVEINYRTYYQGDVPTFGTAMTLNPQGTGANKNGSSNHDSYVVRVNGEHYDCYGPNVADTATSYSWNLGVKAGFSQIAANSIPSNPRYGILNQGNTAWNDGCSVTGNDAGFNSDSSAVSYMFNCSGTTSATSGGVFSSYVPV